MNIIQLIVLFTVVALLGCGKIDDEYCKDFAQRLKKNARPINEEWEEFSTFVTTLTVNQEYRYFHRDSTLGWIEDSSTAELKGIRAWSEAEKLFDLDSLSFIRSDINSDIDSTLFTIDVEGRKIEYTEHIRRKRVFLGILSDTFSIEIDDILDTCLIKGEYSNSYCRALNNLTVDYVKVDCMEKVKQRLFGLGYTANDYEIRNMTYKIDLSPFEIVIDGDNCIMKNLDKSVITAKLPVYLPKNME